MHQRHKTFGEERVSCYSCLRYTLYQSQVHFVPITDVAHTIKMAEVDDHEAPGCQPKRALPMKREGDGKSDRLGGNVKQGKETVGAD